MKVFKVKNYKGNIVESLKRFSERHPSIKIIEVVSKSNFLSITGEEKVVSEGLFDFLKMKKKENASEQEQLKSVEISIKKYIAMLACFSDGKDDELLKDISVGKDKKIQSIIDRYEKEGIEVNEAIRRKIEEIAKKEAKKALENPDEYLRQYTMSLPS